MLYELPTPRPATSHWRKLCAQRPLAQQAKCRTQKSSDLPPVVLSFLLENGPVKLENEWTTVIMDTPGIQKIQNEDSGDDDDDDDDDDDVDYGMFPYKHRCNDVFFDTFIRPSTVQPNHASDPLHCRIALCFAGRWGGGLSFWRCNSVFRPSLRC